TQQINKLVKTKPVSCPIFMAISHEDETISSNKATHFFSNMPNARNQLLLYSATNKAVDNPHIQIRLTKDNALRIKDFSHLSLLFSSTNSHYGLEGDYIYASNPQKENIFYGAYNPIEIDAYNLLYSLGLTKFKRQELTYNPDFDFMMQRMTNFVLNSGS